MQFDVGPELRRVRESRKLSLRAVATAVGVSASLLSQVETGKTQPSVSTLYALVNYLGISLDGLMGHNRVDSSPLGLDTSAGAHSGGDPPRATDSSPYAARRASAMSIHAVATCCRASSPGYWGSV